MIVKLGHPNPILDNDEDQCDQIGLFLKGPGSQFVTTIAYKLGNF